MIKKIIKKVSIICTLIMVISCNFNKGNSVRQESMMKDTLVFTGCQEKISLKAGSVAEIRLEAIQGTGYQWLLKEASPILQQLGSDVLEYSSPENKENMTGQAGLQVLRFKALNKGNVEVLLEYKRTFENQVEKSCRIKIEIE